MLVKKLVLTSLIIFLYIIAQACFFAIESAMFEENVKSRLDVTDLDLRRTQEL